MNQIVLNAIENTKQLDKDQEYNYWEKTLKQRLFINGAGSVFTKDIESIEQLEEKIINSKWIVYNIPGKGENITYLLTQDIKGYIGVIDLNGLDDEKVLVLDDRKGTGFANVLVEGIERTFIEFSVMILGLEPINGVDKEVVFTIHPGNPITPSKVKIDEINKSFITVKEAKELRIKYAKIV